MTTAVAIFYLLGLIVWTLAWLATVAAVPKTERAGLVLLGGIFLALGFTLPAMHAGL